MEGHLEGELSTAPPLTGSLPTWAGILGSSPPLTGSPHSPAPCLDLLDLLADGGPLLVAISLMTLFLVAATILVQNIVIVFSFFVFRRLRSSPSNLLILCLALADILVGLFLLISVIPSVSSSQSLQQVISGVGSVASVSSLLSVTAIAADKMVSVAWPFMYGVSKKRASRIYGVFIWASAAAAGAVTVTQTQHGDSLSGWAHSLNSSPQCTPLLVPPPPYCRPRPLLLLFPTHLHLLQFLLLFIPSTSVLITCQIYVFTVARRHARSMKVVQRSIYNKEISDNAILTNNVNKENTDSPCDTLSHANSPKLRSFKTKPILIATTASFLIAWLPVQTLPLLLVHFHLSCSRSYLLTLSVLPLLASSCLNPSLYSRQNSEVKEAIVKVLTLKWHRNHARDFHNENSKSCTNRLVVLQPSALAKAKNKKDAAAGGAVVANGYALHSNVGQVAQNNLGKVAQNNVGQVAQNNLGQVAQNKTGHVTQNKTGHVTQNKTGHVTHNHSGHAAKNNAVNLTHSSTEHVIFNNVDQKNGGHVTGHVKHNNVGHVTHNKDCVVACNKTLAGDTRDLEDDGHCMTVYNCTKRECQGTVV